MTGPTLGYILGGLLIIGVAVGGWLVISIRRTKRRRERRHQYINITKDEW